MNYITKSRFVKEFFITDFQRENGLEETLKEEGNIDYKFLKSVKDGTFMFVEQWESVEALSKHMASPHFQLFSKESADLAEGMGIKVLGAEEVNLYE